MEPIFRFRSVFAADFCAPGSPMQLNRPYQLIGLALMGASTGLVGAVFYDVWRLAFG
jgi:hypothetical protein